MARESFNCFSVVWPNMALLASAEYLSIVKLNSVHSLTVHIHHKLIQTLVNVASVPVFYPADIIKPASCQSVSYSKHTAAAFDAVSAALPCYFPLFTQTSVFVLLTAT